MTSKQTSLLAALLAAKVECVVVGGVAVNMHGYTRATRDLDIFIRSTWENARAAYDALVKHGVPLDHMDYTDLLCDEEHLRFGPDEDHVDILSSIGDMHFDQVWSGRVEAEVEGIVIPFISKADLIENKIATGRHRDLGDVEVLERIQSKIE